MLLKRLEEGADFPHDFWNYRLNPILGYEYKPAVRVIETEEQKYNRTTQAI